MKQYLNLLKSLSEAHGPSGFEDNVRTLFAQHAKALGELSYDALGNTWLKKEGSHSGSTILLDAHMDEVGFMVQSIRQDGTLKVIALGGWWSGALPAQRVQVQGACGPVLGVFACPPPHQLPVAARNHVVSLENLYIDIGANSRQEVADMGVALGDAVTPHALFEPMGNPYQFCGKALDNRLGLGVMMETLSLCERQTPPCSIVALASVQEELGCRGALTAMHAIKPDMAIVLEGPPADDRFGCQDSMQAQLGKGPQLRLYDPTTLFNRKLCAYVGQVAKSIGVDIQIAVRPSGGTNAKSIHLHEKGCPCVVLGVPARYIHSHSSIADLRDYDACIRLVHALVTKTSSDHIERFRSWARET